MNAKGASQGDADALSPRRERVRWVVRTISGAVLMAAILFWGSGSLAWPMGWVYLVSLVAIGLITAAVLDPSLLAERSRRRHPDQKPWDRVLFVLYGLTNGLAVPLLAALDRRFAWCGEVATWIQISALVVYGLGWVLGIWAMAANKYFAEVVRIQQDRGQTVTTAGPYRYVRHPGYLGGIASLLATPLLLGSIWSSLAGILGAALLLVRTALEDRVLQEELPGYADYARQVRHRLIPGAW